ncbi:hypothetical protein [Pedobacter roseus]|uniref:Uncharacterized protein n=1 Tax=Pedobacter roseus TaxID=336820 RepID=A0A7G9QI13_9SPHI|nr:hypothetical protein [Pedobacter roseus]QNN42988.1 hypothetical protein H9L23_02455 [Pedobacter roseus]
MSMNIEQITTKLNRTPRYMLSIAPISPPLTSPPTRAEAPQPMNLPWSPL